MIEYLAILRQNGELLFSKNYAGQAFEEEVLMGFFASVSNFSQAALQMFVDEIGLGEYKKIVLVMAPYEKIIIGAIVEKEDAKRTVQRVLNEILLKFIGNYGPQFQRSLIKVNEVERMIATIFAKSVRKYGFKQKIKSWFV